MDRNALQSLLDAFLEIGAYPDYCPNGLQVEGKEEIKKVGFAVTSSYETIKKASEEGVDALIVHHGLFWKGDSFALVGSKKKRLEYLFKNEINLFAYHLPLDGHKEVGNNWKVFEDLKLSDPCEFVEVSGSSKKIGVIGTLPHPLPVEEAIKLIENYYGHEAQKALRASKKMVERVAILSGGGYRYIPQAKLAGADLFITGNFDEPAWHMALEEDLHFAALGHSATEVVGVKALQKWLEKSCCLETLFIQDENPF